jgi:hypothetical protein
MLSTFLDATFAELHAHTRTTAQSIIPDSRIDALLDRAESIVTTNYKEQVRNAIALSYHIAWCSYNLVPSHAESRCGALYDALSVSR